jgi:hypothetical protein
MVKDFVIYFFKNNNLESGSRHRIKEINRSNLNRRIFLIFSTFQLDIFTVG